MAIVFELRDEKKEIEAKTIKVEKALEKLGLSPQAYLVMVGDRLVTDRDKLKDGDLVKLISVISGG